MTMLYFGNEMDALIPSDSSVVEVTTAGRFDPTYCRCSITVPLNSSVRPLNFAQQTGKVYFNFSLFFNANLSGSSDVFLVKDALGTTVFKLSITLSGSFTFSATMFYYNGTSLVQVGSSVIFSTSTVNVFTVVVDKPNGIASLYIADSLQTTGTASFASIDNMASVVHTNIGGTTASCNFSQMFASTTPTIGQRLMTVVENTNGANQDWTGAVTDINEIVYNDTTGITAASATLTSTYFKSAATYTQTILGVGVSARFNAGVTGPQNIQNVVQVSSVNYNSPSTLGAVGFAPAQFMWLSNPATSGPWTGAVVANIQWGVESIT